VNLGGQLEHDESESDRLEHDESESERLEHDESESERLEHDESESEWDENCETSNSHFPSAIVDAGHCCSSCRSCSRNTAIVDAGLHALEAGTGGWSASLCYC